MATKGIEKVERRFIQVIAEVTNVGGQVFREGDVLEIDSVIAYRPGEKGIGICCLSPLYFDWLTEDEAEEQLAIKESARVAAEANEEIDDDPLAGLGL